VEYPAGQIPKSHRPTLFVNDLQGVQFATAETAVDWEGSSWGPPPTDPSCGGVPSAFRKALTCGSVLWAPIFLWILRSHPSVGPRVGPPSTPPPRRPTRSGPMLLFKPLGGDPGGGPKNRIPTTGEIRHCSRLSRGTHSPPPPPPGESYRLSNEACAGPLIGLRLRLVPPERPHKKITPDPGEVH